ncbi:MAG TPA: ornithine cyclodeaminase family protein [Chloroflexota bacterium]|nr:ornithine cyclodeaminase family protein [Chloroflexota bacterium]
MTLLLTNEDVEQVLDMPASLKALEPVYRELATGGAVLRHQSQTYMPGPLPDSSYCLKTVEGGSDSLGVMALRVTSDVLRGRHVEGRFRREKVAAAPGGRFLGLVLLFSLETGELLAIMPDGIIQRLRVGASSALAARHLARTDARIVGLIGAGNQAEAQLRGLACVRNVAHVRVYSPTAGRRTDFATRMSRELGANAAAEDAAVEGRPASAGRPGLALGCRVEAVDSPEDAVRGADIVLAATNSGEPVIGAGWLDPGMHVSFIREIEADNDTLGRADVLAVHTKQGEIQHYTPRGREALADLQRGRGYPWQRYPELADLIGGSSPGRTDPQQITMFMNNFGIGIQFAALGAGAWRECRAHGLGQDIPSDWFLESLQP